jgi:hypothetical protein
MTNEAKAHLVEQLSALADDPRTETWNARLYMAAAHLIAAECVKAGTDTDGTALGIISERVQKRDRGPEPEGFRGCVNAWLDPARYR